MQVGPLTNASSLSTSSDIEEATDGAIQHDHSPVDFTTAYEANLTAWIPVFGQLGQAYMDNPAGTKRSITDIPGAMFNSVMDAQLAIEHVDAAIQSIVSDAHARNVPLLWWIGP